MAANVGTLHLTISARVGDGGPSDIGTIDVPIRIGEVHGSGQAVVALDLNEFGSRIEGFASAVRDELDPAAPRQR